MTIFTANIAAGTSAGTGFGGMGMIVMMVILLGVMYFTMMRPQKKQQQKRQEMLNEMKKGDRIVTIGGLHGVIDTINKSDKTVVIDSDGIYLTFNLGAIRTVLPAATATADENQATSANDASATTPDTPNDAAADDKSSDDSKDAQ